MSKSDVIRQALVFYHDKVFPNYLFYLKPAAEQKKRAITERKILESMSDEDFVKKTLSEAFFVSDSKGIRFVLLHALGNDLRPVPVSGFKTWSVDPNHAIDISFHNNSTTSVLSLLSDGMKESLKQDYDLVFPV